MAEDNSGGNAEVQFVEVDGAKFQADPENEGQPLKDEQGNPVPFEEKGEGGEGEGEGGEPEAKFVEQDGKKFQADPDDPSKPLTDEQGNPVPFVEKEGEGDKGKKPVELGEPPVRNKRDFIINRLQHKREKKEAAGEGAGEGGDEGDDPDYPDPEDEKRILKVFNKHYGGKISKIDEGENERELDQFFAKPEHAKFKEQEATIRRWWKHPSRNNLPIKSVAYEVMGESLLAAGAKQERKANEEGKKTGSGGHSSRGSMPKKDAWGESPQEFAQHQEEVRRSGGR